MLKICLVYWESEPQYAYKLYAYKKNMYLIASSQVQAFINDRLRDSLRDF